MEFFKCACGADGRYQNRVAGMWVITCGKRGCLNPPKITVSNNTQPLNVGTKGHVDHRFSPPCIDCPIEAAFTKALITCGGLNFHSFKSGWNAATAHNFFKSK